MRALTPISGLLAFALAALGCGTTSVCPREEPVAGADGGVVRCLVNIDCPRPSNVLVCTNTVDRFKGCVDCVATECIYFRPGPCP